MPPTKVRYLVLGLSVIWSLCTVVIAAVTSLGGIITISLTSYLLKDHGRQEIFRAYSWVGIVWAIAFYFYFRTKPKEHAGGCPDLRLVISHMGHPWEDECVVLIRKHPNLYANIFGSDFPSATPEQVVAGQMKINDILEGTNLPRVPDEMIHNLLHENWKRFLPEYEK